MRSRSAVAALKMDLKALSRTAWAVVLAFPWVAFRTHSNRCAIPAGQDAGRLGTLSSAAVKKPCLQRAILPTSTAIRKSMIERSENTPSSAPRFSVEAGSVKSENPDRSHRIMSAHRLVAPISGRVEKIPDRLIAGPLRSGAGNRESRLTQQFQLHAIHLAIGFHI